VTDSRPRKACQTRSARSVPAILLARGNKGERHTHIHLCRDLGFEHAALDAEDWVDADRPEPCVTIDLAQGVGGLGLRPQIAAGVSVIQVIVQVDRRTETGRQDGLTEQAD
jgi:hypothetical protein